jgi:hypothetical protein
MTCEELIAELRKYPPDTLVAVAFKDGDGDEMGGDVATVLRLTEEETLRRFGFDMGGEDGAAVPVICAFEDK